MIVLFWEIFLINPSVRLEIDVNQAVLCSSVFVGFVLFGGFRDHTMRMLSDRMSSNIYQWKLWQYLYPWAVHNITVRVYRLFFKLNNNNEENVENANNKVYLRRKTSWKGKNYHPKHHNHHHHHRRPHHRNKKRYNRTASLYRKIPLNSISRLWGRINEKELPVALRKPLLGLYVWCFAVDLSEASDEDLSNYRNLGEFFRRTLKPHLRSVDERHCLTSPADGKVLHYGVVEDGVLEQVKGVTYSLEGFLGPPVWSENHHQQDIMSDEEYNKTFNIKPGNKLFHCVVYLAPGDYHRFHSACDWTVKHRRHFPGDLLSVNPWVAHWLEDLFKLNERVVYSGSWKHGFFAYIPVGATNVGSIKVYCDSELVTNTFQHDPNVYFDKSMCTSDNKGLKVRKGEMFGEFNLGSTIVLLFEAPETFKFNITNGQKVQFGQALGDYT